MAERPGLDQHSRSVGERAWLYLKSSCAPFLLKRLMRTGMPGAVLRVGQIPALIRLGNLPKRKLPLRLRSRNIRLLAEEANKIHAFRFILHLYRRYFVIDSEFKGCVAPGGQIGKCDPALCDVIVKNCSVVVWECTLKRRIYCDITFFDEESCIDKANRAVKREQRSVWVDNSGVAVAFGRRVAELESSAGFDSQYWIGTDILPI